MDISIIVPVFNEVGNLEILHSSISSVLKGLNKDYEIIYVDDGSKDSSPEILKLIQSKDNKVKLIIFDKNYGQTSALDAGLRAARGSFIITLDADLQYDPVDITRIIEELEYSDVVICYRTNRELVDGYVKAISSRIARYIRNRVLKEYFKDTGSFRGIRKSCLESTILYRSLQVFIPSLLSMKGFSVKEIPIKTYPRRYGKSKYGVKNRIFKQLYALLVVKWLKDNLLKYKVKEKI